MGPIMGPRCPHTMHRCGSFVHMSHVAWSECRSVGHTDELCKNG